MENKLFELAARRRSVRRYTNEHIDDNKLNANLDPTYVVRG